MSDSRFAIRRAANEPAFVTRKIGTETVIVPVASEVGDLESVYVLNDVGSCIWELLRAPMTLDDIASAIVEDFAVERDLARTDAVTFLDELASRGLICATSG